MDRTHTTVLDRQALIQGLRDQGANVEIASPISQPFFSVRGQILRINGEEAQTFEYATEEAARTDATLVSPDGFTIGTTMFGFIAAPHFFQAGRVITLYVGDNQAVLGPLRAVMGDPFAGGASMLPVRQTAGVGESSASAKPGQDPCDRTTAS